MKIYVDVNGNQIEIILSDDEHTQEIKLNLSEGQELLKKLKWATKLLKEVE